MSNPSHNPSLAPRLIALGLGMAATVLAFHDAWLDIFYIAKRDEEASHIWLVVPMLIWLVLARLAVIKRSTPRTDPLGLAILLLGAGMSVLGFERDIQLAWHLGAVIGLLGVAWVILGRSVIRAAWPAAIVLLFFMPVPGDLRQSISIPMQRITAQLTEIALVTFGFEIQRAGSVLVYRGVEIAVAEACNGMRMVTALLLVGFAYAMATDLRPWVRGLLLLLSPIAAVLCNIIRLIATVWVYGISPETIAKPFHDLSGWVMLGVSLVLLMGVVSLLKWLDLPITPEKNKAPNTPASQDQPTHGRRDGAVMLGAAALVVGMGFVTLQRPSDQDFEPYFASIRQAAEVVPYEYGPWIGTDRDVQAAAITLLKPNVLWARTYRHRDTGETVSVMFLHCGDTRDMTGHYPPNCYPAHGHVMLHDAPTSWNRPTESGPEAAGVPQLDGHEYHFSLGANAATRQTQHVANTLLTPTGLASGSMSQLYSQRADYRLRLAGAAQVQVLTSGDMPNARRHAVQQEMFALLWPAMQSVLQGPFPQTSPTATPSDTDSTP